MAPPPAPTGACDKLVPGAAAKRGRPRRRQAGILPVVAQAAAMAAGIAVFLLVAAASTALLLALVAATRASRRHRGSRYCVPSMIWSLPNRSPPPYPARAVLSPAELRSIPSFAFRDGDGDEKSSSTCAVCLEAARAGERWREMPACRHEFHAACVDRWLARSAACPLCRAAVVTASTS